MVFVGRLSRSLLPIHSVALKDRGRWRYLGRITVTWQMPRGSYWYYDHHDIRVSYRSNINIILASSWMLKVRSFVTVKSRYKPIRQTPCSRGVRHDEHKAESQ